MEKQDKCEVSKNHELREDKENFCKDKLESGKMADLGGVYTEEPRQGAREQFLYTPKLSALRNIRLYSRQVRFL